MFWSAVVSKQWNLYLGLKSEISSWDLVCLESRTWGLAVGLTIEWRWQIFFFLKKSRSCCTVCVVCDECSGWWAESGRTLWYLWTCQPHGHLPCQPSHSWHRGKVRVSLSPSLFPRASCMGLLWRRAFLWEKIMPGPFQLRGWLVSSS